MSVMLHALGMFSLPVFFVIACSASIEASIDWPLVFVPHETDRMPLVTGALHMIKYSSHFVKENWSNQLIVHPFNV